MEEVTPVSSQNSKRIAKNTLMLYFRMILTMLVSLYTSRVILNTLGVEDYGIYNVVGGVVTMFAFFNGAMSSATQRFLSFELGKGDFVKLRKTFNAAQMIHIGIAVLIFILSETVGLWFVKTYLVIPPERMEAALWVYHFSVLSFMISIIQVPYNAMIISHERMHIYAYFSILEVSLKLLIVFILTWISFDKLKLYGILLFAITLIITAAYRIYALKHFKETKFQLVKDKVLYKTLISFSGWSLFGSVANVAKGQGVTIILNIFFGPVVNAARAIASQVQSAVYTFVSNFQIAINPQIIKSFAEGSKEYMYSLIFRSAKFSFYLLFIITLPIILEIDQILFLWLKTIPEMTSLFTIFTLIIIQLWALSNPLVIAIQATGNIRLFQIISGTTMILILPLSYIFFRFGYPPILAYLIDLLVELILLFVRLLFVKKLINFPFKHFLKDVIVKNVFIVLISIFIPIIIVKYMEVSILRLIIVFCVSILCSVIIIYYFGLLKAERSYLKSIIKKFLSGFKKKTV